jgi:DNA invertase Pin-like site-specific DNA recombinase
VLHQERQKPISKTAPLLRINHTFGLKYLEPLRLFQVDAFASEFSMPRTRKTPRKTSTGFVAYYRVSDLKQEKSGLGLEAQRHALSRYTPILNEYVEVESGKRHENRPQLLAALAECKRRSATLLIAKLDRLARNVHFVSGLMESGVDFVAADMPHASKLTVHIFAAMAEHEREMISQRTKDGLAAAIREIETNGFRISRRSGQKITKMGNPRWQDSIEKARAARAKPKQAHELLPMLQAHKDAGKSLREIAAAMNALGIKTATGAQWHPSSVRAALLAA